MTIAPERSRATSKLPQLPYTVRGCDVLATSGGALFAECATAEQALNVCRALNLASQTLPSAPERSADEVEQIRTALADVTDLPIDHEDAWQLAIHKRRESNIARCYLDLLSKLPSADTEFLAMLNWLGDRVLACDYGDNDAEGQEIGWRIRHDLLRGPNGERQPAFMYGKSFGEAIKRSMAGDMPKIKAAPPVGGTQSAQDGDGQRLAGAAPTIASSTTESDDQHLREALRKIKSFVVGEKSPNWAEDWAVYQTRGKIADLCDIALAHPNHPKRGESKPLSATGRGVTCEHGTVGYCSRCALRDPGEAA